MARLSSKLLVAVAASSLFTLPLLAQEKNGDGNPPKDQKPGDGKPNDGKPKEIRALDEQAQALEMAYYAEFSGQCTNTHITNGDFSALKPGVQLSAMGNNENNISQVVGWSAPWTLNNLGIGSLADLYPNGGDVLGTNIHPVPPSGNWAGAWIANEPDAGIYNSNMREGLLNKLLIDISGGAKFYTLQFKSVRLLNSGYTQNAATFGLYAVNLTNGSSLPPYPTSVNIPANVDLFGPKNLFGPKKALLIGTISVPQSATGKMNYKLNFSTANFNTSGLLTMTHLMIVKADNAPLARAYFAFDDFCMMEIPKKK